MAEEPEQISEYPEYETLQLTIEDGIAVVVINRPDKLNSLNAQAKEELWQLFEILADDDNVRIAIVTGAGTKAFVAGTDIDELQELDGLSGKDFAQGGQAVLRRIEQLRKPVIAAVNGYALGGGFELALACHLRIASQNAKFGFPEVGLGIIPGYGGTQRISRVVGKSKAYELILTGNHISAEEAHRLGIINAIVPQEELMASAKKLAQTILTRAPIAIELAMEAIQAGYEQPLSDGLRTEANLFAIACGTDDFIAGVSAFLEKRKPEWTNG